MRPGSIPKESLCLTLLQLLPPCPDAVWRSSHSQGSPLRWSWPAAFGLQPEEVMPPFRR